MSENNKKQLPEQVKSLPLEAKKIFLKAFNSARSNGKNDNDAIKVAFSAVRVKFSKKGNSWVKSSKTSVKTVVARAGFLNKKYYVDIPIASNNPTLDEYIATESFLEAMVREGKVSFKGDLEHNTLEGNLSTKNLFFAPNITYQDGKIIARLFLDEEHQKADWFKKNYFNKEIMASAEFYNPKIMDNKIVDAEGIGWSVIIDKEPMDKTCIAY